MLTWCALAGFAWAVGRVAWGVHARHAGATWSIDVQAGHMTEIRLQ